MNFRLPRTALAMVASSSTHPTSGVSLAAETCNSNSDLYQQRISNLANKIKPRVLKQMYGSGNFGESGSAAFYTIDNLPNALHNIGANKETTKEELKRVDIDLGEDRLAFYVDDVLSHDEADTLASCAEAVLEYNGHSRLAPGINTPPGMRVNEAAHWYPSYQDAPHFLGGILNRVSHLVPQTLDGMPLHPKLSEKVAQFKYNKGDEFKRHVDGLFPGQGANEHGDGVDTWTGVVSGMSMLFFLNDKENDGLLGGETRLWSADGSEQYTVTPKKGRVLFFRRGSYNAVLHAGLPVTGQVPKYMALVNLAYGKQTGIEPM